MFNLRASLIKKKMEQVAEIYTKTLNVHFFLKFTSMFAELKTLAEINIAFII